MSEMRSAVYYRMKQKAEQIYGRELSDYEIIEAMAESYDRNQKEIGDLADEVDNLTDELKKKGGYSENLIPVFDRIEELLKISGNVHTIELVFKDGELQKLHYVITGEETNEPFCW